MKCWICGNDASTGEHLTKRSDLRSLFGTPNQKDPIFHHTAKRRNRRIGSLDSKMLKSPALICNDCNSARTQPHDRAWQIFSETLRANEKVISRRPYIRANRVFPYDTRRAMLYVHLYWLKLFGCAVVEGGLKIDISSLAISILNERANPRFYLAFGWMYMPITMAGGSDIETANLGNACAFATRVYNIGNLAVRVMYAIEGERRQGLVDAWHPRRGAKRLALTSF